MAETKQFHFATETSLGFIEGDLHLKIDGSSIEGSFNALGVDMRLREGHYENGHFTGKIDEVLLFTPVQGTLEGQIDGDKCTMDLTTASGTRHLTSM